MLHKFRMRLTALCTSVTALILAVLTVICLSLSQTGVRKQENLTFQANINTLFQSLQQQTVVSHLWLQETSSRYQFLLRILDNGTPLYFQRFFESETEKKLLDEAQEIGGVDTGIRLDTDIAQTSWLLHKEFPLNAFHGSNYLCSAALIPHQGSTLGVLILHPLDQITTRIHSFRKTFLLADLAALGILTFFYWLFIGHLLKPIEENREKQNQFVASASHELRSPLTVILSQTEAVKSGSMPQDAQFLDTIYQEGQRMSRLLSDLLQLAAADKHSWSYHPEETELDTLLLDIWESYEPQAKSRHLNWNVQLPENPLPPCLCDGERIRQLLHILIDNAFSYTPEGGKIQLSLAYRQKSSPSAKTFCFCLMVSDNGSGIPDSQKEAVFERFYRADPSRTGTAHYGLGLSIAREIVRLHKGKLLLTDTPQGGATFTVLL